MVDSSTNDSRFLERSRIRGIAVGRAFCQKRRQSSSKADFGAEKLKNNEIRLKYGWFWRELGDFLGVRGDAMCHVAVTPVFWGRESIFFWFGLDALAGRPDLAVVENVWQEGGECGRWGDEVVGEV